MSTNMEENKKFVSHLKERYPELDVDKLLFIFNEQIEEVKKNIPENAPEDLKEIRLPLSCDMNKAILAKTISDYLKTNSFIP